MLQAALRMHVVQAGLVLRQGYNPVKCHKLKTILPFEAVYFLGVRGFTFLSYVVYDSLLSA
jgi:hypothetical protein